MGFPLALVDLGERLLGGQLAVGDLLGKLAVFLAQRIETVVQAIVLAFRPPGGVVGLSSDCPPAMMSATMWLAYSRTSIA